MESIHNKIDTVIISASRPKLLPFVIDSFRKYMFYDKKIKLMLHEDFVYPEESKKVIEICKKRNIKTFKHNPAGGIGNAIQFMLDTVTSKYVLILQDDFEFELPIDLNHILFVMDKNPHINNIFFNKRKNMKVINGYHFKEEEYNGLRLCLSNQWPMFNGIWRTDYVRERWNIDCKGRTQEAHWNHTIKAGRVKEHDYLRENVGCYAYGPLLWPRMIRHLGYTWAVKPKGSWARRKDGYGGNALHDLKKDTAKQRAPWLSPEEKRPMYLENKQDQVNEFKDNKDK